MARAKLATVGRKAAKDPQFWKNLRADPEATLRAARLQLTPRDLEKLKRMLRRTNVNLIVKTDAETLGRIIPVPGEPWTAWAEGDIDWASWTPE